MPFLDRWFFLSAPDYVRDKYSKLERKVIKARFLVRLMRGILLSLHCLLLPEIAMIVLHVFDVVDGTWGNTALSAYVAACCLCLLIVFIIDANNNREFERIRRGRKRIDW